jgi:YhcG PDDEXK nuclease domain
MPSCIILNTSCSNSATTSPSSPASGRLRVDDEWYRVDLLLFYRKLRCLVVIDLKLGRFTHADAGQMHLYLNYAREHWSQPEENPPMGGALVRYATDNLPNKVLVREYLTALPDEKRLATELDTIRENSSDGNKEE